MTHSNLPILYTFRRCPYAMRGRMALHVCGQAFEWREILLRDKPAAMLEASDKGTVPTLVLGEDKVIDESLDVMLWALSINDPEGWLPINAMDRAVTYDLIERNDGPFKAHLDRYKYAYRYDDVDGIEHRTAGFETILDLESRLKNQAYLAGDIMGLADYAIFPFIRQFRIADMEWFDAQDIPHVHKWLQAAMASEIFEAIMVKRAPWKEGDTPIIYPVER
ncbi:glutathione S-transferase [Hirschia baltica]|uniref:Glutaredoxin n=1 Tax=Hirschia baltica (strain ATCC 49814 / DSM 5838 / IFAM 1418) TaxID=582402 RepID=C6XL82_HIRBI|nr:glutathione S-transferase [Hirschia baltica]ACT59681.1 glutaredoxin [Hirschia baltica ATCC 49814]